MQPFLALYLVGGRNLSVTTAGVVVACFGAGSIVSQPLGGWLADRIGRRKTMVLGLVASAATLGMLGAWPLWRSASAPPSSGSPWTSTGQPPRPPWLLFALDAATCLVFAVFIARWVPDVPIERDETDRGGYGPVLRDRLAIALCAITIVGACVYMQSFVALPLAMKADGLPPSAYGLAYAVNPIAIIII